MAFPAKILPIYKMWKIKIVWGKSILTPIRVFMTDYRRVLLLLHNIRA